MPLFDFICEDCAETTEELYLMTEEITPPACKTCGGTTYRSWTLGNGVTSGERPRVSSALGVHPSQIASGEAERVHPGARFNERGDMLLSGMTEQKKRLRERGWINRDGN